MCFKRGMILKRVDSTKGTIYWCTGETAYDGDWQIVSLSSGRPYWSPKHKLVKVNLLGERICDEEAILWADNHKNKEAQGIRNLLRINGRPKIETICEDFKRRINPKTNKNSEVKMKTTINKLNGLKKGEEKLVELTQEVSQRDSMSISLHALLKDNAYIKGLSLGKDALLTDIKLNGENLELGISHGEVEREENQALLNSINEMIKGVK